MKKKKTILAKIKARAKILIIPLMVIALVGLLYYFRSEFIVALVNNRPISRLALIKELEKQAGKQVLDSLITKTLILQEARKQKITVSQDEINQELEKLEDNFVQQGQNLDQLLDLQGMSRHDLIEQIKIQKIAEKIAGQDINITDQEVDDYLEENKSFFPEEAEEEEIKATAKQQLEEQAMSQKLQSWLESLREEAKIHYFLKW